MRLQAGACPAALKQTAVRMWSPPSGRLPSAWLTSILKHVVLSAAGMPDVYGGRHLYWRGQERPDLTGVGPGAAALECLVEVHMPCFHISWLLAPMHGATFGAIKQTCMLLVTHSANPACLPPPAWTCRLVPFCSAAEDLPDAGVHRHEGCVPEPPGRAGEGKHLEFSVLTVCCRLFCGVPSPQDALVSCCLYAI
jgi:hypothetical protein